MVGWWLIAGGVGEDGGDGDDGLTELVDAAGVPFVGSVAEGDPDDLAARRRSSVAAARAAVQAVPTQIRDSMFTCVRACVFACVRMRVRAFLRAVHFESETKNVFVGDWALLAAPNKMST